MPVPGCRTLLMLASVGLAAGRSLWSTTPATHLDESSSGFILKTVFPVGNGRLGAMPFGEPGAEKVVLNVDSLWSGGPFSSSDYQGGNPNEELYSALPDIRALIFENGTGNVDALLDDGNDYGSYRVLGNLSVVLDGVSDYTDYKRTLDLTTGIHTTTFKVNGKQFETTVFCSYPDEVCVYAVSAEHEIPQINLRLDNDLENAGPLNVTCASGYVRMTGKTQAGPPEGMKYEAVARAIKGSQSTVECSEDGTLVFSPSSKEQSFVFVIGAGTNYDATKGNSEHKYSFNGKDPSCYVKGVTAAAASRSYKDLVARHVKDYQSLHTFSLDLPDPKDSSQVETSQLLSEYSADGSGDPFVEALLFDLGQHLLISSSRDNSLPANLQGRWAESLGPAWSADYHANVNLQMNYWTADQTGLKATQGALWDYMRLTWVPRGTETAELLYNATGWVVHNEMNIFGHTAMKSGAEWADYPAAAAWMMQHVWDYYEYTQDAEWLADTGYPLIKGVAQFWLSQLQEDVFNNDGTLVVNPCNSPEHGPTTFGCAHYQQEIHQVFDAVLSSASIIGGDDEFLHDVSASLSKLDKGLDYTEWGGVKEWKLPDSYGYEAKNTHRHISHLLGWFPGYSVSSFLGGYSSPKIQSAVNETLVSRGAGTGDDADSGWEKVFRSACWARLNDTDKAYYELRYAIDVNFADNGLSMYWALSPPFQIDANFGLGGAILSMLVVDLPQPHDAERNARRTVVLGPAIPDAWAGGSVKKLRIRGGGSVDFSWDRHGLVTEAHLSGSKTNVMIVNKKGEYLAGQRVV